MNTESILSEAITTIQDEYCRNCEAGKCLIGLKDILDRTEKQESGPEKPDRGKGRPQKPVLKSKQAKKEAPPGMKVCKKCGISKALDEFTKHKECKDGRAGICKACKQKQDALRAVRRKPKPDDTQNKIPPADRDEDRLYICPECRAELTTQSAYESHYQLRHM